MPGPRRPPATTLQGVLHAVLANIGIVIGLITFFWPLITALSLLYLIAGWAVVRGAGIAVAVWMHRAAGNEWMLLLGGIASLLFGVLLAALP